MGFTNSGSPIIFQKRVGRKKRHFILVKFRTMPISTKDLPTHEVDSSTISKYGSFLRRNKLDELPQLWNVLIGDMSIVGPRPCLENQKELIEERSLLSVFDVRPGITGLAQINGVDMSTPEILASSDAKMIKNLNLVNYLKYILLTLGGSGSGDRTKNKIPNRK